MKIRYRNPVRKVGVDFEEPTIDAGFRTVCHRYNTCQMTFKSVRQFEHGANRQTDDRQTDHATEKCVGIAEIALTL